MQHFKRYLINEFSNVSAKLTSKNILSLFYRIFKIEPTDPL
jgi:hypothetical protein